MTNIEKFNLVDESWIPTVGSPLKSLRQVFTEPQTEMIAGSPIQKIALLKLLLAIAQSAYTPRDDEDWRALGVKGMAEHCLPYLDQWRRKFWLYGPEPFLQMPDIKNSAKKEKYGVVLPHVGPENNTVLFQSQQERELTDADKAVLIVTLMGFGLAAGKKSNKPAKRAGSWMGDEGYLHNFLVGENLLTTIWLNLLTQDRHGDIGSPPWESMPKDVSPKNGLIWSFIPLSRFCLLDCGGLYYEGGIVHRTLKEGWKDPSLAVDNSGKSEPSAQYADPAKRPWRLLPSMLSFFSSRSENNAKECIYFREGLGRAISVSSRIGIWSGGLGVKNLGFGDQKVTDDDDFIESVFELKSDWLGECWFNQLQKQMNDLEKLSRKLSKSVQGYFSSTQENKKKARIAQDLYWQFCERDFLSLVRECSPESTPGALNQLQKKFVAHAEAAFDIICPQETARQLEAWSKYRCKISQFNKKNKRCHGNSKRK